MSVPGPVIDIELLVSELEIFYFKVLKKDGWHLFNTQSGFNNESWESIWFLKANYFALKKDKKIYIFNNLNKIDCEIFENIREISLVSNDYNIISIQNASRNWELYDLKNKKLLKIPFSIKHIYTIEKTERFIEIEILDGSKYLYDFTTNQYLQMEKETCVQFSIFDTVYVKKANEEYWFIRDSEWIGPLEPNLYEEVKHYELVPLSPYAGIQGYGLDFRGSSCVRYTFEVELQGRYYITKKPDQQILWFQTTVGGGRSTTLINTVQGHIAFLGLSRHHYKEEKAFFLLKESGKLTLYISTYNRLKTAIDTLQEPPNLDARTLDAIEVCYLHGSYLKIQKEESGWHLYEEENELLSEGFEEIDHLDGKYFIKVKQDGFWHLYQLEKRTLFSDCFSEIYYNDKDRSILMLSKKTVRYISLREIPYIGDCPTSTQDFQPSFASPFLRQNYVINYLNQGAISIPELDRSSQAFQFLMTYTEQCILKKMRPLFTKSLMSWLEEVIPTQPELLQSKKDKLIARRNNLSEKNDLSKEDIKRLERQIAKEVNEINKLEGNIKNWKALQQLFEQYLHIWPGLLRYWMEVDPEGTKLNDFESKLYNLLNLSKRILKYEKGSNILNKHYIDCINLYAFDSKIINNYLIAECDKDLEFIHKELETIQETLLALQSLKGDVKEQHLFEHAKTTGPGIKDCYESLHDKKERQTEYDRLKKYIHFLRLLAISRELNLIDQINSIDKQQFNSNSLGNYTAKLASNLRLDFYKRLGIYVTENEEINILNESYLVNVMYADATLKKDDKILLCLLLKCAVLGIPFNKLIYDSSIDHSFKDRFTNTEQVRLKNILNHREKVKNSISEEGVDWTTWKEGIQAMHSDNFFVRLWRRELKDDLFQGEFCNSCISLAKANAHANLRYLVDISFSMIEIVDKQKDRTIGHVTIWLAKETNCDDNFNILVLNTLQIHRDYHEQASCEEILKLILKFTRQFSQKLNIEKVILGKDYNPDFVSDTLKNSKDRCQEIFLEKLCPTLESQFYCDIYDGWVEPDSLEYYSNVEVFDITGFEMPTLRSVSTEIREKKESHLQVRQELYLTEQTQILGKNGNVKLNTENFLESKGQTKQNQALFDKPHTQNPVWEEERKSEDVDADKNRYATRNWDKNKIASELWKDFSTIISEEMVAKVQAAHESLQQKGFQLIGVEADGNCFFSAFLKSYENLTRNIPLLDSQDDKILYLRQQISAIYRNLSQATDQSKEAPNRVNQLLEPSEWVQSDEGDLLAMALDIPIRILTVNISKRDQRLDCNCIDMLTTPKLERLTWDEISQEERPEEYVFVVDLGGHFVCAREFDDRV